jgi:UDP-glucose 4-epimerase
MKGNKVAEASDRESPTLVVGCGFIGSNVVEEILRGGRAPRVLTRSPPPPDLSAAIGRSNLRLGDAAEREIVEDALAGIGRVVFCAGGLLPAASERDPELDRRLTLGPVEAILAALADRPGVPLTYLSSGGTVYGEPARLPVREDDPTEPVSAYGRLHLACERLIGAARRERALRVRVLRCSTVYGEHQRPDRGQGAIVTFLHRIERGEPIHVYGGGTTIRDYIYVGDVARAVVATMVVDQGPEVINVGSGEGTSLLEILRLAEAEVGRGAEVVQHDERGFDVHRIVLDTTRLRELVTFEPTPLPVGIGKTHEWLASGAEEAA